MSPNGAPTQRRTDRALAQKKAFSSCLSSVSRRLYSFGSSTESCRLREAFTKLCCVLMTTRYAYIRSTAQRRSPTSPGVSSDSARVACAHSSSCFSSSKAWHLATCFLWNSPSNVPGFGADPGFFDGRFFPAAGPLVFDAKDLRFGVGER